MATKQSGGSAHYTSDMQTLKVITDYMRSKADVKIRKCEHDAKSSAMPWPQSLLDNICSVGTPEEAQRILELHPGFEAYEKTKAVHDAKIIFDCATDELRQNIHDYEKFLSQPRSLGRKAKPDQERHEILIKKSILLFSSAAKSVEDYERSLMSDLQTLGYREQVEARFSTNPLHNFIKGLRNVLQHIRIPETGLIWTSNNEEKGFSVKLNKRQILKHPEQFNQRAIEYLSSCGKEVDLKDAFFVYAQQIDEMYKWITSNIRHEACDDYKRCKTYIERYYELSGLKMMAGIFLQQRKLNIHKHLDKFFDEGEIAQILAFPSPEEKADMAIMLMDENKVFDDDLCQLAHRLFRRAHELSQEEILNAA